MKLIPDLWAMCKNIVHTIVNKIFFFVYVYCLIACLYKNTSNFCINIFWIKLQFYAFFRENVEILCIGVSECVCVFFLCECFVFLSSHVYIFDIILFNSACQINSSKISTYLNDELMKN